jgi:DNA-binding NtrC family response regulator
MEPHKEVQIVLASSNPDDEATLRLLLSGTPWAPLPAVTMEEAVKSLHEIALPIVLLDRDFERRPWRENTRALLKARRRTCVIIAAEPDYPACEDVLRRGAFEVLARPFDKDELLATLLSAYSKARIHGLSVTRVHAIPVAATVS